MFDPVLPDLPALPARCVCHRDGSKTYEVFCEWCETSHHHQQIDGVLPPHCHWESRSPFLKTGYRAEVVVHTSEAFASGNFPPGLPGGQKRFCRLIEFSAKALRVALLNAIFDRRARGTIFHETIGNARFAATDSAWNAAGENRPFREGKELLSLCHAVFAISPGAAAVRVLETITGAQFDARGMLEIAAAVNAAIDRAAADEKERRT